MSLKTIALAVFVLSVSLIRPPAAKAQLFGSFVDPVQAGHAIEQIQQNIQERVTQLQQYETQMNQYTNQVSTYTHLINQAQQLGNRLLWKAISNRIEDNLTPDVWGETADWTGAVSGRGDPLSAFLKAGIQLQSNPTFSGETISSSPISSRLGTANIAAGVILQLMKTLGSARSNQSQIDGAISAVERLQLSEDPANNTEKAALNLIGAAGVQNLRMQQSNQALLTSIAEQSIPNTKMWRDEMVGNLNMKTAMQMNMATTNAQPGGMANSASNY